MSIFIYFILFQVVYMATSEEIKSNQTEKRKITMINQPKKMNGYYNTDFNLSSRPCHLFIRGKLRTLQLYEVI